MSNASHSPDLVKATAWQLWRKAPIFFMESYMKPHYGEQGYNYVIPHVYREN